MSDPKVAHEHEAEEHHHHDGDCCSHSHSHEPIYRSEPKTGRNEPCPCKSGKKYKKCCLS